MPVHSDSPVIYGRSLTPNIEKLLKQKNKTHHEDHEDHEEKENKLRVLHALRGANISQKFSSQATVMSEILDA